MSEDNSYTNREEADSILADLNDLKPSREVHEALRLLLLKSLVKFVQSMVQPEEKAEEAQEAEFTCATCGDPWGGNENAHAEFEEQYGRPMDPMLDITLCAICHEQVRVRRFENGEEGERERLEWEAKRIAESN